MLDWLRPPPGLPPRINNMFYAARLKIDGLEFDHILCNRSVTFWAPPGDPIPEDRGGSSPPRRRGKGGSLRARRAHRRTAYQRYAASEQTPLFGRGESTKNHNRCELRVVNGSDDNTTRQGIFIILPH